MSPVKVTLTPVKDGEEQEEEGEAMTEKKGRGGCKDQSWK